MIAILGVKGNIQILWTVTKLRRLCFGYGRKEKAALKKYSMLILKNK
jgi:hypothetical protein